MILAIDPGPEQSAYVLYCDHAIEDAAKVPNADLLAKLHDRAGSFEFADVCVIEMIASYGMPVGREVFETCVWIGRFAEAWGCLPPAELITRGAVKMHLCGSMRAKDSNIRTALLDMFGGKNAIGTKKLPGLLYGLSGDMWSALAVAVTYADRASKPEMVRS